MKVTSYLNLNFGEDVPFVDRVDLAASAGVDGIEFYGWDLGTESIPSATFEFRAPEFDPDEVVERINTHDLELVYMSGDRPALTDPDQADAAVLSLERSVELAEEYDCGAVNVKTGPVQQGIGRERQRQNIIEVLQRAAPAIEATSVTVVVEPLNGLDAPDHFIHTAEEGYAILDAVDSPSIRLLFDFYHEQLGRGNLINNVREHLGEYAAHVHVADPPARGQPGTGEINWEHVFAAIAETEYDGYIGGEFIPQGDPVAALEGLAELAARF